MGSKLVESESEIWLSKFWKDSSWVSGKFAPNRQVSRFLTFEVYAWNFSKFHMPESQFDRIMEYGGLMEETPVCSFFKGRSNCLDK